MQIVSLAPEERMRIDANGDVEIAQREAEIIAGVGARDSGALKIAIEGFDGKSLGRPRAGQRAPQQDKRHAGGGGSGVAITQGTKARTYMKMGTGGIGIGLGGQKYQVIFFFETKDVFDDFVLNGWQGDASAHAVAGTTGKNAEATFTKALAIYQLSENGLMLHADVAGTKYWTDKRLNNRG